MHCDKVLQTLKDSAVSKGTLLKHSGVSYPPQVSVLKEKKGSLPSNNSDCEVNTLDTPTFVQVNLNLSFSSLTLENKTFTESFYLLPKSVVSTCVRPLRRVSLKIPLSELFSHVCVLGVRN